MSKLTNFAENALPAAIFAGGSIPANWYGGFAKSVTDAEAGTLVETTVAGYSRFQIPNDGSILSESGGIATNDSSIVFSTPTATDDADVTHFVLFDAPTGGNAWWITALDTPFTINDGGAPTLAAGDLEVTTLPAKVLQFMFDGLGVGATMYWGFLHADDGEPNATGYARQAFATDGSIITVTGDTASNPAAITFATPTGADDADITQLALFSTATPQPDDLWFKLPLDSPLRINAGAPLSIQAAGLAITFA